ncbi:hypothetical protein RYX56_17955 [Alkalihalophilus lindianensis]|uniref:ABC-2 type transport system permease protein n=1 Tax=Alkalihalophilus lindianensis TaxID=1630542 RepID=A0ABU3XEE0_9BACI|nr:hypothetical protein [Alkalihalophilus lindianensis]MDV2686255.1 hypothetical protein [Alkalihalophilus lindianensis]
MSENQLIKKIILFELKNTPLIKYVWMAAAIGLIVFLGTQFIDEVSVGGRLPVIYDFLFFSALSIAYTVRYKPFNIQDLKGGLYASSFFILLKQTPIADRVIMKSRFIMSAIYILTFNSIVFMLFYVFSTSIREGLSVTEAIILGISWLAISCVWGGMYAAGEPGGRYSPVALVIWSVIYIVVLIILLTAFNLLAGAPYIIWSINVVQTNPLLLLGITLLFLLIATVIWIFSYKYYENKTDYHL